MLKLLIVPVILSSSTVFDIANSDTPVSRQLDTHSVVTLVADTREETDRHNRREEELREHEAAAAAAAAAQRSREMRERAADTAKESHDEKMPARNAHDFYKSF